jgi:hypothetical protein
LYFLIMLLRVTGVSGRLYNEKGQSGLFLDASVTAMGDGFFVAIRLRHSAAHVVVHVPKTLEDGAPLFASGVFYDSAPNSFVTGDNGAVLYDICTNRSVLRAQLVWSGPFEGARLQTPGQIRVDNVAAPACWLEVTFVMD